MKEFLDQVGQSLAAYSPRLIVALIVLMGGWIAAALFAGIARSLLKRTTFDNKLVGWLLGEEAAKKIDVDQAISKGIYYLLLLLVLVAFLSVLNVSIDPLNQFLSEILVFAPRLLGALVLLLLAWILAALLRIVLRRAFERMKLDERVGETPPAEGEAKRASLSETISETAFWLVFVLFLPAVLGALQLTGILEPVQSMINKFLVYLPNIAVAFLILLGGWFLARLVQRLASSTLAASGVDRLGEKAGTPQVLGKQRISGLVGLLVYVLILLPVLIAALDALNLKNLTEPVSNLLNQILGVLPQVFTAAILLILAYIVGRVLAGLATQTLAAIGFDALPEKLGLGKASAEGGRAPSAVAGTLVLVALMLFAAMQAAEILEFVALQEMLQRFTVFAGHVLLGLLIFGVGLFLANLAAKAVESSGAFQKGLLSMAARLAILVFTTAMALRQMGLADEIVNLAFGLLLGAVAVAFALAFGLGGREAASRQVNAWSRNLTENKEGTTPSA
jgi:hypothetical protein